jgi:hypothetical protein
LVDDIAKANGAIQASRLEKIERLYTAHLLTSQDPRTSSMSGESRSESYRDTDGDGNASYYEAAVALDPTGIINDADKRKATLSVPDSKGLDTNGR